jgi:NitT/TauT family transport system ATP-binding protein
MATLVDLQALTIGFGAAPPVLAEVSLALEAGAVTCVVGASGVGKSSLLRVIAGLEAPRGGTVIGPAPPAADRRATALVFREPRLLPWRRVIDNVTFPLEGLGLDPHHRLLRAQAALAAVGLADDAGRWPQQLSPAEGQRVSLARALAVRPRLLMLDHPFSTLEPASRHRLQSDLIGLIQDWALSVLFVTRELEEAIFLADRVIVLGGRPGRVIRDFPVTLAHPRRRDAGGFTEHVRSLRDAMSDLVADGSGI